MSDDGRAGGGDAEVGAPIAGAPDAAAEPEQEVLSGAGGDAGSDVSRVEELERERDEYLDALRRLQADFENYKKRMVRQQTDYLERAGEALVTSLLPVLDALDLAVAHAGSSDDPGTAALVQVSGMLADLLAKEGLERLDPEGEPFDPTVHDAVLHEESSGGDEVHEPEVTEVMRAGYRWKGRVLRPAMVKVKG